MYLLPLHCSKIADHWSLAVDENWVCPTNVYVIVKEGTYNYTSINVMEREQKTIIIVVKK